MNSDIIDNSEIQNDEPTTIKSALTWWEKRRIWFNVAVGSSGIIAIVICAASFSISDVIGLIMYGLFMNLLYSIGFLIDAFHSHYLNGELNSNRYRLVLFLIGTIASCLITFLFTISYYTGIV